MAKSKMKYTESPAEEAAERKSPEERHGGPFQAYEIESAVRTLTQAKRIEKNKALMAEVRKHAKKQSDALTQIHSPGAKP
jgi:hypothetical protein